MQAHQAFFIERCFDFDAGVLQFDIQTEYPVDFNVHHHTETTTVFPVKTTVGRSYSGSLELEHGGEYCFMWTNLADRDAPFEVLLRYTTTAE